MKSEIRTAAILFGGIGGFSAGLKRSLVEAYGRVYRWEILCSIDFDPVACRNHDLIIGEQTAVQMDLFDRDQYRKWFGHEPPEEWQEATPQDIWMAFKEQVPDYLFLSPPCKGFSGLLPEKSARSAKYQALNLLTIRGLELCLEACVRYGDGELPAFIHFENVPRITSRGADILQRIKRLLERYGYAVDMRSDHNLGEIGGLGQNRMRYLLLARNQKRVPNWCYLPPKKLLKTIGDVLGPLPLPDDPAGGPMHRLPRLQWKTWVRLALIPAGGDWRDLNAIDWQRYRIEHEARGGAYAVEQWDDPSRTVTATAGLGRSNGAAAVSDPRIGLDVNGHAAIYRVVRYDEPAPCVTGAHRPNNGAITISDPRLRAQEGKHPGVYRVVRMGEPSPTVTGTRFGSGAPAIADPRVKTELMPDCYGVQDWDEPAKTIRGNSRIMQSASSVADPRIGCSPRSGTMGVQKWDEPAKTVIGAGDIHAGAAAVADPRIPEDNESGTWVIIAEDGTWHRPLTTYELAMLQGFPTHLPDGRPFQLDGCSDAKAREYIGNAVPVPAAEAMGNVIMMAIAQAEAGITFEMSWNDVWVLPEVEEQERTVVH
ncbi:MAG: DNA cytosine methyltransferase [Thermobacillus sp.]|nr:MAG: DNA cytosine methyltransferase [Thermobacillus sp.]